MNTDNIQTPWVLQDQKTSDESVGKVQEAKTSAHIFKTGFVTHHCMKDMNNLVGNFLPKKTTRGN